MCYNKNSVVCQIGKLISKSNRYNYIYEQFNQKNN